MKVELTKEWMEKKAKEEQGHSVEIGPPIKERPILFGGEMVRAIRDGRKTQTRRVAKPPGGLIWEDESAGTVVQKNDPWPVYDIEEVTSPYGRAADKLWVRENGWQRPERTPRMMRDGADTWEPYYYDADGLNECDRKQFKEWGFKRRPSIHMPRWASRITLEIKNVRVERLQDISEEDAISEGIEKHLSGWKNYEDSNGFWGSPINSFETLWQSINGPESWNQNPWVWVIEFEPNAKGVM